MVRQLSFELVLRDDFEDAGEEVFGRELWIPVGEHERRFVVANRKDLTAYVSTRPLHASQSQTRMRIRAASGQPQLSFCKGIIRNT